MCSHSCMINVNMVVSFERLIRCRLLKVLVNTATTYNFNNFINVNMKFTWGGGGGGGGACPQTPLLNILCATLCHNI